MNINYVYKQKRKKKINEGKLNDSVYIHAILIYTFKHKYTYS